MFLACTTIILKVNQWVSPGPIYKKLVRINIWMHIERKFEYKWMSHEIDQVSKPLAYVLLQFFMLRMTSWMFYINFTQYNMILL